MVEQWLNAAVYGLALAVVAWATTRTRQLDAAWRCRTWGAALAGLALAMSLPLGRALALHPAETGPRAFAAGATAWSQAPAPLVSIPALPATAVLAAWASVAFVRVGVLAVAILRIRRARRLARPMPPGRLARLPEWSAANRGRFALRISDGVRTAAMLGFGRPVVAVPPAWLDRLSDAELDAVLLHELAHAERRDDLGQLAEQLLLAACWFHPAAWWMAGRARFEREAACDERAARVTTSRRYARCLVTLAETMRNARWTASTLAPGAVRGRDVGRRVARVMAMESGARLARPAYFAAPTLAAILVFTIAIPSLPRVLGIGVDTVGLGAEDVRLTPDATKNGENARLAPDVRLTPDATKNGENARLAPDVRLTPDATKNGENARLAPDVRLTPDATKNGENARLAPDVRLTPDATKNGENARLAPDVRLTPDATKNGENARLAPDVRLTPDATKNGENARLAPDVRLTPDATKSALAAQGHSLAAPFGSLGASVSNAGKRTGSWFSRVGLAVADRVTPD